MKKTNLHLFWRNPSPVRRFRTGVSLHSHTLHSEETLAFVPKYTAGIPVLGSAIRRQEDKYRAAKGRALDFSKAFWRPPLAPGEACQIERRQIEGLGLDPLVSLSDHDDIQAGRLMAVVAPDFPISVEWTIPFGPSFFHLGVHNLPPRQAPGIMSSLAEFTAHPVRSRLGELIAFLNEFPETLIVLNHPAWDEPGIGELEHAQLLGRFLERYGMHIHALELNGLRPWRENLRVSGLAQQYGHVLISGGDRHGLEANANLNLTNAQTFAEFVVEIRDEKISDILFMPQYRESLRLRMIETMWDVVREYPEFPAGRRRWSDRVFYKQDDGTSKPVCMLWNGNEPWVVKCFVNGLRAMKHQGFRGALRLALGDAHEVVL